MALTHISELRKHIKSEEYHMTCCTISEAIGMTFFMALKYRGLMPKFKEIRSWREFKCWLLGHIIKSIEY